MDELQSSRRIRWRALLAWGVALVCVRGLTVLALGDVFFYGEELEKGAAAIAMGRGLDVPLHQWAYHAYEGGGFVTSLLDRVAFALLGPNLLALKVVATGFALGGLVFGMALCGALFGAGSVHVYAALYVFAPGGMQLASLLNLGIHFQALPFLAALFWLGDRLARGGDSRDPSREGRHALALGAVAGFGIYFNYQVGPAVVLVGLGVLLRNPGLLRRRSALLGVLGTAVGLLPLAWMASHVGGGVFDIHGDSLASTEGPGLRATLGAFFDSIYGVDFRFPGGLGVYLLPAALLLAWGAGWALAFRRKARGGVTDTPPGRGGARWMLSYVALFLALYLWSGFAIGAVEHPFYWNRLSPLWWSLVVLAAGVVPWLGSMGPRGPRVLGTAILVGALAPGVWAFFGALASEPLRSPGKSWELLRSEPGYSWPQYFGKLRSHLAGTPEEGLAKLLQGAPLDPLDAREYRAALGNAYLNDPDIPGLGALRARAAIAGEGEGLQMILGAGPYLRFAALPGGPDPGPRLAALVADERFRNADFREAAVEALGRLGLGLQITEERLLAESRVVAPEGVRGAWDRGLGWRLAHYTPWRLHPDRVQAFLRNLPAERGQALLRTYREALLTRRL